MKFLKKDQFKIIIGIIDVIKSLSCDEKCRLRRSIINEKSISALLCSFLEHVNLSLY